MIASRRSPVWAFGDLKGTSGYPREPAVLTFPRHYKSAIFRDTDPVRPAPAARMEQPAPAGLGPRGQVSRCK